MDRREKQRKFHQAIIGILYPPPPTPNQQQEEEEEDPSRTTSVFDLYHIKDPEDGPSSPSSDDKDEEGPRKLTRAKRKRLRKKKLNESAASSGPQRRKIIGPLLAGDNGSLGEGHPQGVRQNAAENQSQNTPPPGTLLPSAVNNSDRDNGSCDHHHHHDVSVVQNAAENQSQSTPAGTFSTDPEDCNAQKERKLKRRRMGKKLAREKTRPSHHLDECDKDGDSARE